MIRLRDYQREAVGAISAAFDRGVRRGLVVLPTGTGKSTVIAETVRTFLDDSFDRTALCIAHRKELLDQMADRIRLMAPGLDVAVHSGDVKAKPGAQVVVASVQSLAMGGQKVLEWLCPSLVVTDEAHHAAAESYQNVFRRAGVYDPGTEVMSLGFTATPHRLDNLSLHGTTQSIYEEVLFERSIGRMLREGWLADVKGYSAGFDLDLSRVKTTGGDYNQNALEKVVDTDPVNEAAYKAWLEVAKDRRTLIFCVTVDHAQHVSELFLDNGVRAGIVHGKLNREARDEVMDRFRTGEIQVLTNCEIVTEGVDVPECSAIILLRPTKSWSLYTQMVGRGLRTLPGVVDGVDDPLLRRARISQSAKPDCAVIDVVQNAAAHRLGTTPDSDDLPALNALFELPVAMDLEDASLLEAMEDWDGLPEEVQAVVRKRATRLTDLKAEVLQISLLADVEEAEEAKESGTRLVWIRTKDFPPEYSVSCGFSSGEKDRRAKIVGDALGGWTLHMASTHRDEKEKLPSNLAAAFIAAEEIVQQRFFGVSHFASKSSPWRNAVPTDAQIAILRKAGIPQTVIDKLDRGRASLMIDRVRRSGWSL